VDPGVVNRHHAIVAGAALVLVGVAVGLVAVPLTEMEPRPPAQAFEVGGAPAYGVAGNISVEGNVVLGVDGVVNDSGASRVRILEENVVSERYRGHDADVEYRRFVLEPGRSDRLLATVEDDPERTVLAVDCRDETVRVVVASNETTPFDPPGAAAVVLTELQLAAYERVDSGDGADRRLLRPRSGWYESRRSYRLTGATGRVIRSPKSNVVHSADVTWNQTVGTETYAHYLLRRNETVEKRIQYRYRPGEVTVERPAWVENAPESDPRAAGADCR
jgi:hypothetical protein